MLGAARKLVEQRPQIRFEVAAASSALAVEIQKSLASSSLGERIRLVTGDASGLMQRAFAGMVASGTATLEAAYFRLPSARPQSPAPLLAARL